MSPLPLRAASSSNDSEVYQQFEKECRGALPPDIRSELKQYSEAPLANLYFRVPVFSDPENAAYLDSSLTEFFAKKWNKLIQSDLKRAARVPESFEVDVALRYLDIKAEDYVHCVNSNKADYSRELKALQKLEASENQTQEYIDSQIYETSRKLNPIGLRVDCLGKVQLLHKTLQMSEAEKEKKFAQAFDDTLKSYEENLNPSYFHQWYPRVGKYSGTSHLMGEENSAVKYLSEIHNEALEKWRASIEQKSAHLQGKTKTEIPPFDILSDRALRPQVGAHIISEALNIDETFASTAELASAWESRIRELTSSSRNHAIHIYNTRPLYVKIRRYLMNVKNMSDAEIGSLDLSDTSKRKDRDEIRAAIHKIIKDEIQLKYYDYLSSKSSDDASLYTSEKAQQSAGKRVEESNQAALERRDWFSNHDNEKLRIYGITYNNPEHAGMPYWKEKYKEYTNPWVGIKGNENRKVVIEGALETTEKEMWESVIRRSETCRARYALHNQKPGSFLNDFVHEKRIPGKGYEAYYQLSPAQDEYIKECVEAYALNAFKHAPEENQDPKIMVSALHKWHEEHIKKIDSCGFYATIQTEALRNIAKERVHQYMRQITSREAAFGTRAYAAQGINPSTSIEKEEYGALLFLRSSVYYTHHQDVSQAFIRERLFRANQIATQRSNEALNTIGKTLHDKYGLTFMPSKDLRVVDYSRMSASQLRSLLKDPVALTHLERLNDRDVWLLDLINLRLLDAHFQQREAYEKSPQTTTFPARPPLLMMGGTILNVQKSEKEVNGKKIPEWKYEYFTSKSYNEKASKMLAEFSESLNEHDKEIIRKSAKRDGFFYGGARVIAGITGNPTGRDLDYKHSKENEVKNFETWNKKLDLELNINGQNADKTLIDTALIDESDVIKQCKTSVNNANNERSKAINTSRAINQDIIRRITEEDDGKAASAGTKFCVDLVLTAAVSVATAGVGGVVLRVGAVGARALLAARAASISPALLRSGSTFLGSQALGRAATRSGVSALEALAKRGTVLEATGAFSSNTAKAFHTLYTGGSSGLYGPAVTSSLWTSLKVGATGHAIMAGATPLMLLGTQSLSRMSRNVQHNFFGRDPRLPPDAPFWDTYWKNVEGAWGQTLTNKETAMENGAMMIIGGNLTQAFFTRGIAKNFTQKEIDDLLLHVRNLTPQQTRQGLSSAIASGKISHEMAISLLDRLQKLNSAANWKAAGATAGVMQIKELPSTLIERNNMQKRLEEEVGKDKTVMSSAEKYQSETSIAEMSERLDGMWHDYVWGSFTGDFLFTAATTRLGAMMPTQSLSPEAFRRSALNRALQRASSISIVRSSSGPNAPVPETRARMLLSREAYESYILDFDSLVQQVPIDKHASLSDKIYIHTTQDGTKAQPIKKDGKEFFAVEIPRLGKVEEIFIESMAAPITTNIPLGPGGSPLPIPVAGIRDRGWLPTLSDKQQGAAELGRAYEENVFGGKSGSLIDVLNKANARDNRGAQGQPQGAGAAP